MKRHDTPHDVATALARHAPQVIHALLDPAVGGGNLIAPLASRLRRQDSQLFCVDSDLEAVNGLPNAFRGLLPPRRKFIHSDFLSWSHKHQAPKFDCIVMNPPFAAGKADLYECKRTGTAGGTRSSARFMPLEAAFLCRALELLADRGRLLAIVPCSVVMSESLQWLRDELLLQGAIRFVHELPPRSFPGVDSRMYLMVFDKGARQRQIALLNHDLHWPERLSFRLTGLSTPRLDFGFVNAEVQVDKLREHGWLKWTNLEDIATVTRGDIESPRGPLCAVHSTDFRNGFWRASHRHDASVGKDDARRVRRGDILISRVGRNSHRSCGGAAGVQGMACSDCVLIVRPKSGGMTTKILFALRAMLYQDWAKPLVEKGTGASYISHNSLLELPIPLGVCARFPRQFEKFRQGERVRSARQSLLAVTAVASRIAKLCN